MVSNFYSQLHLWPVTFTVNYFYSKTVSVASTVNTFDSITFTVNYFYN